MPWLQHVVNKTWRPRERNRGLSNIVAWICKNTFAKFLLLLAGAMGPDQHPAATGLSHRLHHQLVEILQNMVAAWDRTSVSTFPDCSEPDLRSDST